MLRTISLAALFFANQELHAGALYWDGGTVNQTSPGNGQSAGGAGSWSTGLANWDDGLAHLVWSNSGIDNDAYFAGTGGNVTLASAVTVNDLSFYSSGYSIAGTTSNKITLNGNTPTVFVDANLTATISAAIAGSSAISGTAALTKTGSGTLSFTSTLPSSLNNTYTGGTVINAGTLAIVADANLGTAPTPSSPAINLTINGGTLQIIMGFSLGSTRQILLGPNNATIALNSTADFKAQSVISGGGSLTIQGSGLAGSYIPSGANTYTGDTHLGPGVITTPNVSSVWVSGNLVSGPYGVGTLYLDGARLRSAATGYTIGNNVVVTADTTFLSGGSNSLTFTGPVTLQGNRTFTAQNTGNINFTGAISNGAGASSFTLGTQSFSNSTIVLAGINTYTGVTSIEGGTLRIGGPDGSIPLTSQLVIPSGTLIIGDAATSNNVGKVNRLNSSLALRLGGVAGGTFTIVGGGIGASAQQQSFASLSLGRGVNTLNSSSTSASSEANLVFTALMNNFLRSAGSILNYTSATGFSPSFAVAPSGLGASGGVLAGVIRNGTDFVDANSLVFAAASYSDNVWSVNTQTNITLSNAPPFTGTTGSLRFNTPGSAALTLSGNANVIQSGNILVTANVGAANPTSISGGAFTSGNGADLIVVQNNGAAITGTTTSFPAALTISSTLTDNGGNSIGFTKAGTGVVILSGSTANTFTGITTVLGSGSLTNFAPLILAKTAGTNAISGNLSIGSTGYAAVYLAASQQIADQAVIDFQGLPGSNAFFQLQGFDETIAGLVDLTGVGVVEVEEQQVINLNSTLTLSGSGSYTFNGALRNRAGGAGTGVLNLVVNGTGSQTLSGPSISYTGSTTIQNGTLNLVETPNFASSLTLGTGNALLQISGATTSTGLQTSGGVQNTNAIVQNAAGVSAVLTINQASDSIYGGILRDNPNQTIPSSLGFTKAGNGALTLTNTNPFSGSVTLNGGTLAVGSNGALGTGPITFNNANSVIRSNDANARTLGNVLNLSTSSTFGSSTTGNLLFTSAVDFGSSNKSITILNQQTEFSGVFSSLGAGMLTKLGAGHLVLSGSNTYTGATIVSEGTFTWSGNRTDNAAAITVGNSGANATFNLSNGNFTLLGDFVVGLGNTGTATVNQSGGTVTLSNTTNQLVIGRGAPASAGTYNLYAGTLIGQSSASNGITLGSSNDNSGTFNLSGTGIVSMPTAMLQVGSAVGLADRTNGLWQQSGGTATFGKFSIGGAGGGNNDNTVGTFTITAGSFYAAEFSSLAGGDTSTATITIGGTAYVTLPAFPTTRGVNSTANLTFNGGTLAPVAASTNYMSGLTQALLTANGAKFDVAAGKDITIAQAFSNAPAQAGSLFKLGAGALTLSGSNSYTGPTTISAGKFNVNGSLTSTVEVQANAILGGSGTITGNITGAGTVAPGNSIGTLTVLGDLQITGTHAFEISKDPQQLLTNDRIVLSGSGNLRYDGKLQIQIPTAELATLTSGDQWDLYDASGLISGAFSNGYLFGTSGNGTDLPMLSNNLFWQFDYQAGVLSVSAVPEPSTLIIIAALGICWPVRNRLLGRSKSKVPTTG